MHDKVTKSANESRHPQRNVPEQREHRDRLIAFVHDYVTHTGLVAPLSLNELKTHSQAIVSQSGLDAQFMDYTAVILNNEVWRPTIARIPYNKRLLLLPQCLRDKENCPADFDELGLLCRHCGRCIIDEMQTQAEQLGYAVLIAEGSPVVMNLIETGGIEAVIGVSCLSVLEKTFPYMEAGAIPGIAIPLLYEGCVNTTVDADRLWDAVYLNSEEQNAWLDLDNLRKQTNDCFTKSSLKKILKSGDSPVEKIALEWLSGDGKRHRPFLTAGVYQALTGNNDILFTEQLSMTVTAVECFHKASLIHDDIEDNDHQRYGRQTLHRQYNIPIALNVGDYLLGEGYRLLAELDIDDRRKAAMLSAAAHGHRRLCLGQGAELDWAHKACVLSSRDVLDIFRLKTSPAFEVALKLGAILAGHGERLAKILAQYSDALGVAYQIQDDGQDLHDKHSGDLKAMRPSVLLAIAYEQAAQKDKQFLADLWMRTISFDDVVSETHTIFDKLSIGAEAYSLMESYKHQAMQCLEQLDNTSLKALLRRVICKIFNDIEILECCDDYKAINGQRRREGGQAP